MATIVASTLFNYQHHVIDSVSGALLGACFGWVKKVYD